MKIPVCLIVGPTATGKSSLAVHLAKEINGEIISADAYQIYRHMDIGTAKIKPEERQNVLHYCIDEKEIDEEYNAFIFQEMAKGYIEQIHAKQKIPIICGGTGFYINALIYQNEFQQYNPSLRLQYENMLNEKGKEYMYALLKNKDEEYALGLHPNNTKKVIRALEFLGSNHISLSEHNRKQKMKTSPYDIICFKLFQDRSLLYDKINKRVMHMIQEGLVMEVKDILAKYGPDHRSLQAIGYKEVIDYLQNKTDFSSCISQIQINSRRYAKRQYTWFNHQLEGISIDSTNCMQALDTIKLHIRNENFG